MKIYKFACWMIAVVGVTGCSLLVPSVVQVSPGSYFISVKSKSVREAQTKAFQYANDHCAESGLFFNAESDNIIRPESGKKYFYDLKFSCTAEKNKN